MTITVERLEEIKQEALRVAKESPLFTMSSCLKEKETFLGQIRKDLLKEEEQKEGGS